MPLEHSRTAGMVHHIRPWSFVDSPSRRGLGCRLTLTIQQRPQYLTQIMQHSRVNGSSRSLPFLRRERGKTCDVATPHRLVASSEYTPRALCSNSSLHNVRGRRFALEAPWTYPASQRGRRAAQAHTSDTRVGRYRDCSPVRATDQSSTSADPSAESRAPEGTSLTALPCSPASPSLASACSSRSRTSPSSR